MEWSVLTCGWVQDENGSHKYFQEQQSSYETACYDSQYLDRSTHCGCFAVATAAAATAAATSAPTRESLCWKAEGSRFCPDSIIQDKFNFIIFS